jgi:O-antigen ligase
MTLTPLWRTRLFTWGAGIAALWIGFDLARQDYFWPMLVAGGLILLTLRQIQRLPIGDLLLGMVLFGYIAGNRGFAQVSLTAGLPLFPAESFLLLGGALLLVRGTFQREIPVRRDALNLVILGWMLIGTVRLGVDLPRHGFTALRDFATVYYAAFFFLAQAAARHPASRLWLQRCLLAGCLVLIVLYPLTEFFPGFFLNSLTLRGNPLIYYKGDLAGTFLFVGSVFAYHHFAGKNRLPGTLCSLALAGLALTTNNRASMVGVFIVTVLLLLGGRWRYAATQTVAGVVAAIAILFAAYLSNRSWRQTPLLGVYERVVSLADPFGRRRYGGDETFNKGDNNRFRAVWWKAVFDETTGDNPWFGLGFGYDLAQRFVQEYYPEQSGEFDTRSPHNIMLTLYGRTGLAGLLPFLCLSGMIAWRLVRAAREQEPALGMWCAAGLILVSACFGVVLEGPMGAVVFWVCLGVANSSREAPAEGQLEEISAGEPRSLPNPAASA